MIIWDTRKRIIVLTDNYKIIIFSVVILIKFYYAGQGRFGKVYTVVNNQTGELLAMKEVQLQPGDHRAIRRVAEELQIFEGIQHQHLVRYYGLEIHRV